MNLNPVCLYVRCVRLSLASVGLSVMWSLALTRGCTAMSDDRATATQSAGDITSSAQSAPADDRDPQSTSLCVRKATSDNYYGTAASASPGYRDAN